MSSDESVTILLRRTGKLAEPITLTRRLFAAGMTLKGAHMVVNRLALHGWASSAVARTENLSALTAELAEMNIELRQRCVPSDTPQDIIAFRAERDLSQREFADLMGIDLRTLQNWEQGRNRPDPAVLSLMRIYAHAPEIFEEALSEPVLP